MQLKKRTAVHDALATATYALLGTTANDSVAIETNTPWEFDTAVLFYTEQDRVSALEPVFKFRKEVSEKEFLNFRFVIDALTGASANGTVPMPFPQTFTKPSGNGTYTTPANETPLDDTFKEIRAALNVEWEKPVTLDLKAVYGANISREYDYTSLGGSAIFSLDTNAKNTTYTGGISINFDLIEPVGGTPVGMTEMPDYQGGIEKETQGSSETKTIIDLLFGLTQVLNRQSLLQINYSIGSNNGYLTDPYKLLSIIDDNPLNTIPDGQIINSGNSDGSSYRHENRPDSRLSQSLYAKLIHQFTEDVVYLSYRYFWDDWNIASHTLDFRYRFELGNGHYLQPHLRYYTQSAADFYKPYLLDSEDDNIKNASADYRLGELITTTIGLLYGIEISQYNEFIIRAELMNQTVNEPDNKIGILNNQDLSTDLDAFILQLGYSFIW